MYRASTPSNRAIACTALEFQLCVKCAVSPPFRRRASVVKNKSCPPLMDLSFDSSCTRCFYSRRLPLLATFLIIENIMCLLKANSFVNFAISQNSRSFSVNFFRELPHTLHGEEIHGTEDFKACRGWQWSKNLNLNLHSLYFILQTSVLGKH